MGVFADIATNKVNGLQKTEAPERMGIKLIKTINDFFDKNKLSYKIRMGTNVDHLIRTKNGKSEEDMGTVVLCHRGNVEPNEGEKRLLIEGNPFYSIIYVPLNKEFNETKKD